jgi:hypothetical protein
MLNMSSKLKYNSQDSLNPIVAIINDANQALNNPRRTKIDSEIGEMLGAIAGVGAGGAMSFGLLGALGVAGYSAAGITSGLAAAGSLVGGGMVAGIGVLAAPAVVLGVGAYAVISKNKKKKLKEQKEALLKEAVAKQNAIINELQNDLKATKDRAEYLNQLNVALQYAIKDLKDDLGYAV